MNIQSIQDKLTLIQTEGKQLLPKQINYVENNYDSTCEELEQITYHWSQKELILSAPVYVINSLYGIAGYDFSIVSAAMYVKHDQDALIVVTNEDAIHFFKEIFIDSLTNKEIDNDGNFIYED